MKTFLNIKLEAFNWNIILIQCRLQICPVKSLLSLSVNSEPDWSQDWFTGTSVPLLANQTGEKKNEAQKCNFKPASCPELKLKDNYRKQPNLVSLLLRDSKLHYNLEGRHFALKLLFERNLNVCDYCFCKREEICFVSSSTLQRQPQNSHCLILKCKPYYFKTFPEKQGFLDWNTSSGSQDLKPWVTQHPVIWRWKTTAKSTKHKAFKPGVLSWTCFPYKPGLVIFWCFF